MNPFEKAMAERKEKEEREAEERRLKKKKREEEAKAKKPANDDFKNSLAALIGKGPAPPR